MVFPRCGSIIGAKCIVTSLNCTLGVPGSITDSPVCRLTLKTEVPSPYDLSYWLDVNPKSNQPNQIWFQVFISVIDKNDNAPICTKDLYEYSVIGTKSIGQLKDSVKATDADEGSNGDIFYTMSPQTDRNGRRIDLSHLVREPTMWFPRGPTQIRLYSHRNRLGA